MYYLTDRPFLLTIKLAKIFLAKASLSIQNINLPYPFVTRNELRFWRKGVYFTK